MEYWLRSKRALEFLYYQTEGQDALECVLGVQRRKHTGLYHL